MTDVHLVGYIVAPMETSTQHGLHAPSRHARLGMALLTLHLFLSPLFFLSDTSDAFEYSKVALLCLVAILLAALGLSSAIGSALENRREALHRFGDIFGDRVGGAVLFFALSCLLSSWSSLSPRTSWRGAHGSEFGCVTILAYAVLFFATRAWCRTTAEARRLLSVSVCASAVACGYALLQLFRLDPIAWTTVSTFGPYVRPFATMGHPNHLAAFLVLSCPIVFHCASRAVAQRRYLSALVCVLVGISALLVIVISISRGAWLALLVALVIIGCGWLGGQRWRAFGLACGCLCLALVGFFLIGLLTSPGRELLTTVSARIQHLGDPAGRQHLWSAALAVFRDHPLLGCGSDCFAFAFVRQRTVDFWLIEGNALPRRVHNEALHVLATQGFLGGLAGLLVIVGLVRSGLVAWRRHDLAERKLLIVLFAGLGGFVVESMFSFTVAGTGTLAVTFAALLSRGQTSLSEDRSTGRDKRDRWHIALLVLGLLLVAVVFGHNISMATSAISAATWAGLGIMAIGGLLAIAAIALIENRAPVEAGRVDRSASEGGPKYGLVLLAFRAVIFAGAGLLATLGVLRPAYANILGHSGELLLPFDSRLAQEQFAQAAALDPRDDLHWGRLAAAAQRRAKNAGAGEKVRLLQQSRQAYEQAIALVPVNAFCHVGLGRVLMELAREHVAEAAQAFQEYELGLRLEVSNPYYFADAANAALVLNDLGRARDFARRGLELFPTFGPFEAHLGYAAMVNRHYDEAAGLLRQAVAAEWYGDEAGRQLAAGKLQEAIQLRDRVSAK